MLTNSWGTETPKLARINPADMSLEISIDFASANSFPGSLKTDAAGTSLYFIDGQVFKMHIAAGALPTSAFATAFAYKCGVDPVDDLVYISDAGDFNSNGKVYRYQSDGTPVDTFDVGVIPAEFAFTD